MLSVVFLFFFFKQKTAYEMRISDWSSDVCSSDLGIAAAERYSHGRVSVDVAPAFLLNDRAGRYVRAKTDCIGLRKFRAARLGEHFKCVRSEEHTSELQSLMRISYAVFCLKKKKHTTYIIVHTIYIQSLITITEYK